ncbi:MAG: helix-turn-helix transcriptional regulator [Candidatus Gastranaerophilales bacterium]|nr:helix-turn-helix transcriptional regulator [Candidatus Gastranaerophilales bacterium]
MTNSTILKIKENIKKYRELLKLSQENLSEAAGISADYVSLIERGKRIPSVKRLCMIAKTLGVEPYELLK